MSILKKKKFYKELDKKNWDEASKIINEGDKTSKEIINEIVDSHYCSWFGNGAYKILEMIENKDDFNKVFDTVDLFDIADRYEYNNLIKIWENDAVYNKISVNNLRKIYKHVLKLTNLNPTIYLLNQDHYFEEKVLKLCEISNKYALRLLKELKEAAYTASDEDYKKIIDKIENIIIEGNDIEVKIDAYELVNKEKKSLIKQDVLKCDDARLLYLMACKVPARHTKQFVQKIKETNDYEYIIKSAIYLDHSMLKKIGSIEKFFLMISLLKVSKEEKEQIMKDALQILGDDAKVKYIDHCNTLVNKDPYAKILKDLK